MAFGEVLVETTYSVCSEPRTEHNRANVRVTRIETPSTVYMRRRRGKYTVVYARHIR
jgi:hypothetical protein